jgi:hypothetical protein
LVDVNGFMVYLALLVVFDIVISPYARRTAAQGPMGPVWLVPLVAVMIWSGVGSARAALRTIMDQRQRWMWRAVAVASLLLVALAAIALVNDIHFFVSDWLTY